MLFMKTYFNAMKKKTVTNILFTALTLVGATAISFGFFFLGNKNPANITVIYILALILISMRTDEYIYGIVSSIFCVFAVNYFFSYPYFKFNFSLAGYPVTFIGMLTISLITGTITTRLHRQTMAVQEREKELAEADKEKLRANLLRAVSHDLRTPLTGIIGSSSSYLENYRELTEAERTELVENIKEDSEWLLNMVENLLTVTRIRSNTEDKVHKSSEVVEEVVSEALQRLRKRLPGLKVRVSMPNDFLMLPMDPTLIEQVIINLVENACIHSGSTEPVDLFISESEDDVSFKIRDYGSGVDEKMIPYIFEGQQTASETSDGHRGIGIGLSICKTIIQAHGGHIGVCNRNPGAEFTFTLPKEKEQ